MIRILKTTDIAGLNKLPPKDWHFDYEHFVRDFSTTDYFYAFVMTEAEAIIGTGNVLLKGNIAWLANIIVSEAHRGQGLGYKMTKFLVDFIKNKGGETQLLIATALGEPVYKKIGFKKISEYRCFHSVADKTLVYAHSIRELSASDLAKVCKMDQAINAEDRAHLITKYYQNGLGYFSLDDELLGFYLPNFARGLVLATEPVAGLELLKLKHSQKGQKTLLPIENQAGISFFENSGFVEGKRCARMILGKENDWNPAQIYAYGGGYCG